MMMGRVVKLVIVFYIYVNILRVGFVILRMKHLDTIASTAKYKFWPEIYYVNFGFPNMGGAKFQTRIC